MRKVRIKGTDIYVKCIDVDFTPQGNWKGIKCEYLTGGKKGSISVIPGDCLVEENENIQKQTYNVWKKRKNDFIKNILDDKSTQSTWSWLNEYKLLIRAKNYDEMHKMFSGKAQWSIANSKNCWDIHTYWKGYMNEYENIHYVLIDFTKENDDPYSMITFTYDPYKKIITLAHNKNGEPLPKKCNDELAYNNAFNDYVKNNDIDVLDLVVKNNLIVTGD